MAISDYDEYQLLDDWRRLVQQDIWLFNQATGGGAPLHDQINTVLQVYTKPDRDLIAQTLTESYEKLRHVMGYGVKPVWVADELVDFDRRFPLAQQNIALKWGYIQAIGRRATTLIEADAAIVYTSVGGLGVNDTATITVNTTVDADEIAIFYRVADGAPSAANVSWQIYPAKVTKVGNVATITAHRANFIDPTFILQPFEVPEFLEVNAANSASAGDYITLVDVYRVYPDTTTAVQLEADPYLEGDLDAVAFTVTNASALIVDKEHSVIRMRSSADLCPTPRQMRVSYLAGYPLGDNGFINQRMANALIRLTNADMRRTPVGLGDARYNIYTDDKENVARSQEIPPYLVNNPFGFLRGHVESYRTAVDLAQGQGGLLTGISRW